MAIQTKIISGKEPEEVEKEFQELLNNNSVVNYQFSTLNRGYGTLFSILVVYHPNVADRLEFDINSL